MKILIAYDGSAASDAAIDLVSKQLWPERSEVRVVTVFDVPLFYPMGNGLEAYPPVDERVRQDMREDALRRMQVAADKLRTSPGIRVTSELREGDVKLALLEAIKVWGADLVVVGSHGKGAIGRLFLGSVSHALVTHAPCNVEVVRTKAPAA